MLSLAAGLASTALAKTVRRQFWCGWRLVDKSSCSFRASALLRALLHCQLARLALGHGGHGMVCPTNRPTGSLGPLVRYYLGPELRGPTTYDSKAWHGMAAWHDGIAGVLAHEDHIQDCPLCPSGSTVPQCGAAWQAPHVAHACFEPNQTSYQATGLACGSTQPLKQPASQPLTWQPMQWTPLPLSPSSSPPFSPQ